MRMIESIRPPLRIIRVYRISEEFQVENSRLTNNIIIRITTITIIIYRIRKIIASSANTNSMNKLISLLCRLLIHLDFRTETTMLI